MNFTFLVILSLLTLGFTYETLKISQKRLCVIILVLLILLVSYNIKETFQAQTSSAIEYTPCNSSEDCPEATNVRVTVLEVDDDLPYIGWNNGNGAFRKNTTIQNVIIDVSPGSPTKIPNFTFSGCSYLKSVVIKTGITEIAHSVFSLCEELESVEIPESVTKIGSTTFSSCRKLTTVNIPHGISSIEYATFSLCEALQQITIPSSVRRIGRNAFAHCKMLQEIVVPENVETIEAYAFRQCRDLKSITLSENLTKIGKQAFDYCLKVKNIIIPDSVTEIGDKAFYETGRLPWGQPFNITMPRSLAQNPDGSLNNGFLAGLGLEPRRSRQIFVNGIEFVNQSTTTSALSTTTANGTTAAGTTANGNTTSMTQRPIGEDDDMFLFNGNKIKNVKDFLDRDVKKQVRNDRDIKSELLKLKFA